MEKMKFWQAYETPITYISVSQWKYLIRFNIEIKITLKSSLDVLFNNKCLSLVLFSVGFAITHKLSFN